MSKKIVSVRQLELLTEFMENHKDLALGRVRSKEGRALSQRLWAQCADILNAEDVSSSYRSPKEWNKFYNDYKCRLKNKIRRLTQSQSKTGGGPSDCDITLSSLEERLSTILGPDAVVNLDTQQNPVENIQIEEIIQYPSVLLTNNTEDQVTYMEHMSYPAAVNTLESSTFTAPVLSVPEQMATSRSGSQAHNSPPMARAGRPTKRRLIQSQKGIDDEVERTRSYLLDVEKERMEVQKTKMKAAIERIDVEKEKVAAINNLASAAWALVKVFTPSPKNNIVKKRKNIVQSESESDD